MLLVLIPLAKIQKKIRLQIKMRKVGNICFFQIKDQWAVHDYWDRLLIAFEKDQSPVPMILPLNIPYLY